MDWPLAPWHHSILARPHLLTPGTSAKQDLFSYTSGRLLFNENLRLQERYVKFNLPALLQEAETMVSPDNNHGHAGIHCQVR